MDIKIRAIVGLSVFLILGYLVELAGFICRVVNNIKVLGNKYEMPKEPGWKRLKPKDVVLFVVPMGISLFLILGNNKVPEIVWYVFGIGAGLLIIMLVHFVLDVAILNSETEHDPNGS